MLADELRALARDGSARAAASRASDAASIASAITGECRRRATMGEMMMVYEIATAAINQHGAPLVEDVAALLVAGGLAAAPMADKPGALAIDWRAKAAP